MAGLPRKEGREGGTWEYLRVWLIQRPVCNQGLQFSLWIDKSSQTHPKALMQFSLWIDNASQTHPEEFSLWIDKTPQTHPEALMLLGAHATVLKEILICNKLPSNQEEATEL